ncbi:hypothetical protein QMG83_11270 [Salinibacterium sp. G-O1]|uniref:hypothetical protein n=1 Tax=Salinibacterium sp. G-O1 TaxID=3046208 RepID=UPI0024B9F9B9|nr:hypothetical protein [Salinibacterium sp. G-O1]MDJ0335804.1 hypothetical protein [Salinibacterium sp. G-O1]
MRSVIATMAVAVAFGLLFAWDVWEAVSNLVALPDFYDYAGFGRDNVPWWLLITGVAIPVAVFVIALMLGRGRPLLVKVILFVVGLAVASALGLGVIALEDVLRPTIVLVPR